jgi:hypothetical protein
MTEHLTEWIERLQEEIAQLRAERDALTRACYHREGPVDLAYDRRCLTEAEVINEIRKAAGLRPIPAEAR